MLHILIVYTLLLLFLIGKQFWFLCPQLVVKTKDIDTLIKILLCTYLLTSADSSWEFLIIENTQIKCKQLKAVVMDKTNLKLIIFCRFN